MGNTTENFRRNILNGVIRFMRLKSCYERRGLLSRSMMDVHYQLLNNVQQNSCISVIKRRSQENKKSTGQFTNNKSWSLMPHSFAAGCLLLRTGRKRNKKFSPSPLPCKIVSSVSEQNLLHGIWSRLHNFFLKSFNRAGLSILWGEDWCEEFVIMYSSLTILSQLISTFRKVISGISFLFPWEKMINPAKWMNFSFSKNISKNNHL